MPSKRTNDSVDRILADLDREQNAATVRSRVNDKQIDDILRDLGLSAGGGVTLPPNRPDEDAELDDILADLPSVAAMKRAAGSPAAPRHASAPPRPAVQPQTPPPAAVQTVRPAAPAPQTVDPPEEEADDRPSDSGTVNDTTSTGIIKNFLLKMAPEGAEADTDALDQGKNQFKDFFQNSAAVLPDEKGRLRSTAGDDTGEYVPINVSLGGRKDREYFPDEDDPAPRPAKKRRGLFGLFGRKDNADREPYTPEERPAGERPARDAQPRPEPPAAPRQSEPAVQPDEDRVYRSKYTAGRRAAADRTAGEEISAARSSAARTADLFAVPASSAPESISLSDDTMDILRSAVSNAKARTMREDPAADRPAAPAASQAAAPAPAAAAPVPAAPAAPAAPAHTGQTTYRKKRDTVEFVPRKQRAAVRDPLSAAPSAPGAPAAAPAPAAPAPAPAPAAQPVHTYTSTGFTIAMDPLDPLSRRPSDSTQQFMAAFNAVRPERPSAPPPAAPASAPAQQAAPQPAQAPQGWAEVRYDPAPPAAYAAQNAAPAADPVPPTRYAAPASAVPPVPPAQPAPAAPDDVDAIVEQITQSLSREALDRAAARRAAPAVSPAPAAPAPAPAAPRASADTGTMTGVVRLDLNGAGRTAQLSAAQAAYDYAQGAAPQSPAPAQTAAPAPQAAPAAQRLAPSDFVNQIAHSINSEPTVQIGVVPNPAAPGRSDAAYDEAAARLLGRSGPDGQQPAEPAAPAGQEREPLTGRMKKMTGRIRLTGKAEDEQEGGTRPFTEELPRVGGPHYDSAEDAPRVRAELEQRVLTQDLCTAVTAILSAVLCYFSVGAVGAGLPLPGPLDPAASPAPLLVTMLVLLALGCAVSWKTMLSGLVGLLREPTADSMPTLAALGAAVQLAVFLSAPDLYTPSEMVLMAGPAMLLLCFNSVGKGLDARTVRDGFKLVSAQVDHAVAYKLRDAAVLRAVSSGLAEPRPSVLVSRPTQIFKDYLPAAAAHRTSDKNQQQFARILACCAVLSLLIAMLRGGGAGSGVTAMAAVLVLGAPLAGTLLSALPARLMQRSAAQVGAVIPGWKDIRQLGRINVITVTAQDLFPAGCVTLCGINPVHKEHIDLAIVYAASMVAEGGALMKDVFLDMIGNDARLLAKVEDRQTLYGKGYVGWIKKQRVLVGNRALMADYGIQLPSMEYEQRHTVNQRRVVYLAVGGKLFAMFQLAYQRDNDTAAVLDTLRRSGISMIVDCDDFNVDAALLEAAYSLPAGAVKVLTGAEREAMAPATAWLPESEGSMLHLGSFASFVGGLEAAAGAAEAERKAAMVMNASVLLSCVLSLIMVFSIGFARMPLAYIVLYQAAWAVGSLVFPLGQRY